MPKEEGEEGCVLYVRYAAGSTPGRVRPLRLKRWIRKPSSFFAECIQTASGKRYSTSLVTEVRKDPFQ